VHPAVESIELAGSRASGVQTPLSDWDFEVSTSDYEAVAASVPQLVASLAPITGQWDRLSPFPTYMLMLDGPVKVDLLFPGRDNPPAPPWEATAATLQGIDDHFWDWILWLASKRSAGREELVDRELVKLHRHLLGPMGVDAPPGSIEQALVVYTRERARLESRFRVSVQRALERAVRPTVEGALARLRVAADDEQAHQA
jgi:hypothetical protein